MLSDDGIRTELIAAATAESPELSWLADISADNQKAVLKIFMKYESEEGVDPNAMIAELNAIPEVQPYITAWTTAEAHHLGTLSRIKTIRHWLIWSPSSII